MTSLSDSKIIQALQDKIEWDARVSKNDLVFKVEDGKVTVFGQFEYPFRRDAVLDIIHTTQGVNGVIDKTQIVPNFTRTDEQLEEFIAKEINSFELEAGEWIKVKVKDKIAVLTGRIYRPFLKGFATRAVWENCGVNDCVDKIQVIRSPRSMRNTANAPVGTVISMTGLSLEGALNEVAV